MRTDGVHCRESAGTGPVVLKVVPVTGAAILQVTIDQLICASLSHTHYWYEGSMLEVPEVVRRDIKSRWSERASRDAFTCMPHLR